MSGATVTSLEKMGTEIVVTGSPIIQPKLLREDLHWMQRGYSNRQMDFIVAVVLELGLEKAHKELAIAMDDPELNNRIQSIESFILLGNVEIKRRKRDLLPMRDYELKFYY